MASTDADEGRPSFSWITDLESFDTSAILLEFPPAMRRFVSLTVKINSILEDRPIVTA